MKGLRANLLASAEAINTRNLNLPALVATSTARRAGFFQDLYGVEFGNYFPGPRPVAVLGVRDVSPSAKTVLACSLEDGHALDAPGGRPVKPDKVLGAQFEMLLEKGAWKVNRVVVADVSCENIILPGRTA